MSLVTWDISARGLFLCTPNPLELHHLVRISLILPTTGSLMVLHGMVVDVAKPDDPKGRPVGMDIELYAVDAPTRAAWWDLFCFARDGAQSLDPSSSVRVGADAGEVAQSTAPPAITAARSRRAG